MVFDDLRNTLYLNAIKNVIDEDSVVLDLGAGLGLHGLMALSAAAKKVYLVEPASIMDITKMVIKANNLSDKVECISGKIEEIELPEKVDVIISVFTGNFLLTEDLLPSLFYARDKFLCPGGKLIPDRAKMLVVPVSASEYYTKHIDCWRDPLQNVDYSLVRKFAANSIYYDKPKERESIFLSEPSEILELDFMQATEASCRSLTEVGISQNGIMHGWLGWFDARVGEEWLSTSPMEKQMHWSQVFLPLDEPLPVQRGQTVSLEINRPEFGEWSWIVEAGEKRQKQSTFLSEPFSPARIMKGSDSYRPTLTQIGNITQEVLQLFNGKLSTVDIVNIVLKEHSSFFSTHLQAEQFVKKLLEKYS